MEGVGASKVSCPSVCNIFTTHRFLLGNYRDKISPEKYCWGIQIQHQSTNQWLHQDKIRYQSVLQGNKTASGFDRQAGRALMLLLNSSRLMLEIIFSQASDCHHPAFNYVYCRQHHGNKTNQASYIINKIALLCSCSLTQYNSNIGDWFLDFSAILFEWMLN